MFITLAIFTLLEAWALPVERDACWFFADETSPLEDREFATEIGFFPLDSDRICRSWALTLLYAGERPLLDPGSNEWTLRVSVRPSFDVPTIYNMSPQSDRGNVQINSYLVLPGSVPGYRQSMTVTPDEPALTAALGAICYSQTDTALTSLDSEIWLFEYVTGDQYCLVEVPTPIPAQFERLTSLLQLSRAP
jgi:hypothetical protein